MCRTMPRLSYKECADRCAEDFRKAADLLPIDWDKTKAGQGTTGKNQLRVNKIAALAYLGKNYLLVHTITIRLMLRRLQLLLVNCSIC